MKNIIVGVLTLIIVGLMGFVASEGGAYHGGEAGKIIKDMKTFAKADNVVAKIKEKSDREKESDKLKSLREKAGNAGAFKVSDDYKKKCSSCHGVNGHGEQNGKKLMGPKLIGQNADKIYKNLMDFKAGRKENIVMKGLLMGLTEEDLRRFADEIGEFTAREEALK